MLDALTQRYLDEVACHRETHESLTRLFAESPLIQRTIPFSGRALLRPMFLAGESLERLERDLLGLYDLLVSLPERLFGGDLRRYAAAVGLGTVEADLAVRMATPWPPPLLARADLYQGARGFKLLEMNHGSPLGGYQTAELNRLMLKVDLIREFVDREGLRYVDTAPILADLLRRPGSDPVVAVAEWPQAFSEWRATIRSLAARLRELGIDARPCHLGDLREERGRLTLDGAPVDIVFRHFTMAEAIQAPSLIEPFVRAHEQGVAEMFIPLSTSLLGNKVALALLAEERNRDAFASHELALMDRLLPWCRQVTDHRVHVDGVEVGLLEYCRETKDALVLKATNYFSGRGVHTGWTMSEREWAAALETATDGPFVVQERVVPVIEPVPDHVTGALEPWIVNWGLFLTPGRYSGCFLRTCPQPDAGIVNYYSGALAGTSFHTARVNRTP